MSILGDILVFVDIAMMWNFVVGWWACVVRSVDVYTICCDVDWWNFVVWVLALVCIVRWMPHVFHLRILVTPAPLKPLKKIYGTVCSRRSGKGDITCFLFWVLLSPHSLKPFKKFMESFVFRRQGTLSASGDTTCFHLSVSLAIITKCTILLSFIHSQFSSFSTIMLYTSLLETTFGAACRISRVHTYCITQYVLHITNTQQHNINNNTYPAI